MTKSKTRKSGKEEAAGKTVPRAAAPSGPSPAVAAGSPAELAEKMKELVRLAQEQGRLTFNDVTDIIPEAATNPELMEEVFAKLHELEIEVVDPAEMDREKVPESGEEETSRHDSLDDPVRLYLNQMGQVALLTREQEVEISKRIETAEEELTRIVFNLGFTAKEHIALAEKLLADPPRERFDRVVLDQKTGDRGAHLRSLSRLSHQVHKLDQAADEVYHAWRAADKHHAEAKRAEFRDLNKKLHAAYPKFCFNRRSSRR